VRALFIKNKVRLARAEQLWFTETNGERFCSSAAKVEHLL